MRLIIAGCLMIAQLGLLVMQIRAYYAGRFETSMTLGAIGLGLMIAVLGVLWL